MKSESKIPVDPNCVRLIGREEELTSLVEAAQAVVERGERQVITIAGADGSGKTRLLDEACQRFGERGLFPERVFRVQALPGDGVHALIARLLRVRFGIDESYSPEDQEALLRAHATEVLEDRKVGDVCHFLGGLFGVRSQESPLTRALAADPFHAGMVQQSVLASFMDMDAARAPLCLVFEDLQYADYESLEIVLFLAESLSRSTLIVCTGRPESFSRAELWTAFGAPNHQLMPLSWLSFEDADALLHELLCCQPGEVDDEVYRLAAEHGQGNPERIVRVVRSLFASGVLALGARAGQWRYVPERLADFRMQPGHTAERLGTLSATELQVLEYAAMVGESFWFGALVALARAEANGRSDSDSIRELGLALHSLEQRGFFCSAAETTFPGERELTFVHHSEQRAALARIGTERRRRYHRIVGGWLLEVPQQGPSSDISALAGHHFEAGGHGTRAADAYLAAASIARTQYSPERAALLFALALKLLMHDDDARRIQALHDQGDVLVSLGRTGEAITAFEEMLRLARRGGNTSKVGVAHGRIGRAYRQIGRLAEAQKHLQRAFEAFHAVADERGVASTKDDIGRLAWMRGDLDLALCEMQAAFELRKKLAEPRSIALSLNNIGSVCLDRGQLADAEEAFAAALYIRCRIGDRVGQIESLEAQGELSVRLGEFARAIELLERAQRIAEVAQDRARLLPVLALLGHAYSGLGDSQHALAILSGARLLAAEVGDSLTQVEIERALSRVFFALGDLRAAGDAAQAAYDFAQETRSKSLVMRALRTLGTATAAGAWGEANEGLAVDHFMRAIALAKEVGSDLELAKTYREFCCYAHRFSNVEIRQRARQLRGMADEIFARYRPRAAGSDWSATSSIMPVAAALANQLGLPAETALLAG